MCGCARACVHLTAGQVGVGLKPCVLCQGSTGTFFRIDELPASLIKPSVTLQQSKKARHTHTQKEKGVAGRRGNMSGKSVICSHIMYRCDAQVL